eukprot:CAMPEP_0203814678 /NCGR_PEP_ID=MMETSP0115-20131106/5421_1 /ASSEMBLY_ACC=CAM_ASM_000227 /TAXON_ID=33651 /ORGANISM="Bicosoecid sp, Strain ms1" /LENGTH=1457 /DNA_ID=CAMNT_0050723559 /DNA_START=72 /DNA_END=4441 /DNA_ORIENTATION=+
MRARGGVRASPPLLVFALVLACVACGIRAAEPCDDCASGTSGFCKAQSTGVCYAFATGAGETCPGGTERCDGAGGGGGGDSGGYCGDGACNAGETPSNCSFDCGSGSGPGYCGDGTCNAATEACVDCPNDCGVCPAVCGDGSCEQDEACSNCPSDCGLCPLNDDPVCGDFVCNGSETTADCEVDCGPPRPASLPAEVVDCLSDLDFALTFDDGPSPVTHALLDILAAENVRATFFVIGSNIWKPGMADVMRRAFDEGHEIASHTYSHPSMVHLPEARIREELFETDYSIASNICAHTRVFRPPYGHSDARVHEVATAMGYVSVKWNADVFDWKHAEEDPEAMRQLLRDAIAETAPGSLIHLQHDLLQESIDVVPSLINIVREAGYTFRTVSDCLLGPTKEQQPWYLHQHRFCADGACKTGADCLSGVCAGMQCQEPACDDGVRNGAEVDVDCGHEAGCGTCADGATCALVEDCEGGACIGDVCRSCTECDPASHYETAACNRVDDTQCAPLTVCESSVEFERVAPTATSDRVCAPLTTCSASRYESVAPTATSDRVCSPVKTCGDDEYEAAAPTATSDRQCVAITTCGASEWEQAAPTETSDRACVACSTTCPNGQYESVPCSTHADRLCRDVACDDGVRNGAESDVDCGGALCDGCAEGHGCSSGADCESLSCDSSGACAAPTCADGVRNGLEAGVDCGSSASGCPLCNIGQRCSTGGDCASGTCIAGVCASCVVCDAGSQYTSVPCTAHHNAQCASLSVCSATEYETAAPTTTSDRACAPLRVCSSAEYETVAPTATSNRQCASLTVCVPGSQWQSLAPTATSDRACEPHTTCASGTEWVSAVATLTSDRECTPCVAACHSDHEVEVRGCSLQHDRECVAATCADGLANGRPDGSAEADVDCGGGVCEPCFHGSSCAVDADCQSGVCDGGVCAFPTCHDGRKNGWEVCVDGGVASGCGPCSVGGACAGDVDCASRRCVGGMCLAACTVCDNATQWTVTACSDVSDTVCAAVTTCGASQYQTASATATSDAACADCSTCGAGEMVASACSATADTVCVIQPDEGDDGLPSSSGGQGDDDTDDGAIGVDDAVGVEVVRATLVLGGVTTRTMTPTSTLALRSVVAEVVGVKTEQVVVLAMTDATAPSRRMVRRTTASAPAPAINVVLRIFPGDVLTSLPQPAGGPARVGADSVKAALRLAASHGTLASRLVAAGVAVQSAAIVSVSTEVATDDDAGGASSGGGGISGQETASPPAAEGSGDFGSDAVGFVERNWVAVVVVVVACILMSAAAALGMRRRRRRREIAARLAAMPKMSPTRTQRSLTGGLASSDESDSDTNTEYDGMSYDRSPEGGKFAAITIVEELGDEIEELVLSGTFESSREKKKFAPPSHSAPTSPVNRRDRVKADPVARSFDDASGDRTSVRRNLKGGDEVRPARAAPKTGSSGSVAGVTASASTV